MHLLFNRRWRTGYPPHQSLYQTELAGAGSPLKRPDGAGLGDCYKAGARYLLTYLPAKKRLQLRLESGWRVVGEWLEQWLLRQINYRELEPAVASPLNGWRDSWCASYIQSQCS